MEKLIKTGLEKIILMNKCFKNDNKINTVIFIW